MMKRSQLSMAVAAAVGLSSAALMPDVYAQSEQEGEAMEEVVITGSRIRSTVSDAPRPVSIINRLDIELSGLESVADVLRSSTFNSFGSFRERSGSNFGQVALVGLRGLGEDRTAVLVNGRRVPGNPITGTAAVDLNSIPLSAVEKVEILTDSASAVYGADAIGGVINIIMRDEYDGAEFQIGGEWPTREGADSDHFNFTFGANGDKGHVLFAGEWYKKLPIFDADRSYTAAAINPTDPSGVPVHSAETEGISAGGNTGFTTGFDDAFPLTPDGTLATCDTDVYQPLLRPQFGLANTEGCGYAYANQSMQTGGIERHSTFLDASYEISDDHKVYVENRFSKTRSFGRYAPAVGFFTVRADNDLNPLGHMARGDVDGNGMMDDGEDIFAFHRFVAHGNRDDTYERLELDTVVGFKGEIGGGINYDVYARSYDYRATAEGDTYVVESIIEDLVAKGEYDFINPLSKDETHLAAVQQSSATLLRDIETRYTAFGVSLDGAFGGLAGGEIGWAAGVEQARETYRDQYDNAREAGNILGSAGNSAGGKRNRWAAFGEVKLPVLGNLDINIAARFDDYDDFGDAFSPQVAVRYKPWDALTLRASWGQGFKAPNLSSLYQELSSSFETAKDFTSCRMRGVADADCPDLQVEESTGGNPSLSAEETESFNFGVVFTPLDSLRFSVDWFSIQIEDSVDTLDLQDVIDFEAAGTLPPGVIVNRGPAGNITQCAGAVSAPDCGIVNVFANLAAEDIEGLDIRASYDWHTDALGTFTFRLEQSWIYDYDYQASPVAPVTEREGATGYPEFRTTVTARWQWSDWTVNFTHRSIDEHEGLDEMSGDVYPSYSSMDLSVTWVTPWSGELSFGALNLGDEDPSIDSGSGYDEEEVLPLYDVAGRTPFLKYRHFF